MEIIRAANSYQIKGTPTLIINNKKIDRMIPLKYLYIILDELVERSKKRLHRSGRSAP